MLAVIILSNINELETAEALNLKIYLDLYKANILLN